MSATAATPADLLRALKREDATRPLLTFYDDATGERVELSVATFDNWTAKTAGLLVDGLDVEPGHRIALQLPAHWQALAWACACWTVGACVVVGADAQAQVAVAGPDTLPLAKRSSRGYVVGLALRPLGGRFPDGAPAGVLDYAVEVPGYPDQFAPVTVPAPDEPGLDQEGVVVTLGGLLDRARERAEQLGAGPGARVLVNADDLGPALLDALLVPLAVGGSAVLVRREAPSQRAARVAAERVTVIAPEPGVPASAD